MLVRAIRRLLSNPRLGQTKPQTLATPSTPGLYSFARTYSYYSSSSSSSSRYSYGGALSVALAASSAILFCQSKEEALAQSNSHTEDDNSANARIGHAVYSFGSNQFGTLGVGDELSRSIPTLVGAVNGVPIRSIVSCGHVSGLLTTHGEVYTFGKGSELALGHGDATMVAQPRFMEGLSGKRITDLALSETHGAALETDAATGETRVWMWGSQGLGRPPVAPVQAKRPMRGTLAAPLATAPPPYYASAVPFELTSLADEKIVKIACGKHHTLALTSDGRVFSFGTGRSGALGLGENVTTQHTPMLIEALEKERIVAIAAGNGSSLFLNERGEVFVSGANDCGQAGTGANTRRYPLPTPIRSLRNIRSISAGSLHNVAIDANNHAWVWGFNQSGALGLGHRNLEVRQPVMVPLSDVEFAVAGFETTAFITKDGVLQMSGRGREGQLGRGDQVESIAALRDSPVEVTFFPSSGQQVVQASVGTDFTLALIKDPVTPAILEKQTAIATAAARAHRR